MVKDSSRRQIKKANRWNDTWKGPEAGSLYKVKRQRSDSSLTAFRDNQPSLLPIIPWLLPIKTDYGLLAYTSIVSAIKCVVIRHSNSHGMIEEIKVEGNTKLNNEIKHNGNELLITMITLQSMGTSSPGLDFCEEDCLYHTPSLFWPFIHSDPDNTESCLWWIWKDYMCMLSPVLLEKKSFF